MEKETYIVEFATTYEVEAESQEEAEDLARQELDKDIEAGHFAPYCRVNE